MNLLENYIDEAVLEALGRFSFERFKLLPPQEQIPYAAKHLPTIGEGSSRIVFAMSSGKALKIAMDKSGVAQNKVEFGVFERMQSAGHGDAIAKIYDYDKSNYRWLLSELGMPFQRYEMAKRTGGVGLALLFKFLTAFLHEKNMSTPEDIKRIASGILARMEAIEDSQLDKLRPVLEDIKKNSNRFLEGIGCAVSLGLMAADLRGSDQYARTADGRIILVDYGFDKEVWKTYYHA